MKSSLILFSLCFIFTLSTYSQWSAVEPYPDSVLDGAFAVTVNGKAYIGGGLLTKAFYEYDPITDSYKKLSDVPSQGDHLGWAMAFVINQKIYVCGGAYGSASDISADLWEYDVAHDAWAKKAPFLGGKRDGGFAFALNGIGYVGAGFNGVVTKDMYMYDPVSDSWTKKSSYPGGPVIFPASCAIGSKGYVGLGSTGVESDQWYSYDPSTDTWSQKASFTGSLRQTTFHFSDGYYAYVGGGMAGYSVSFSDFWKYDPGNDSWTPDALSAFPSTNTAFGMSFVLNQKCYAGLGVDMPSFANDLTIYSHPLTDPFAGLDDPEGASKFRVYPNPANRHVKIQPEDEHLNIQHVRLIGLKGEEVPCSFQIAAGEVVLDIPTECTTGLYHLQLITDRGVWQSRLVIQR